jgi:hypothetical protein
MLHETAVRSQYAPFCVVCPKMGQKQPYRQKKRAEELTSTLSIRTYSVQNKLYLTPGQLSIDVPASFSYGHFVHYLRVRFTAIAVYRVVARFTDFNALWCVEPQAYQTWSGLMA